MIRKLFLITVAASLLTSCKKQLEITPQQGILEENALSSDAKVKKVLNGAYDAVSDGDVWGGGFLLYAELMAANDEIRWEGTFNQPDEIWQKAIITTNSFVRDSWLGAYYTINAANNVLSAINVVNAADQNRVKGEALFLRGAMFFELVKFYSKPYTAGSVTTNKGIPLVLVPTRTINDVNTISRGTVEQTYTQIIADLTAAEGLLPASNDVYASKAVAAGMLSRVYLQMERFADARDAANRAITTAVTAGASLTATYAEAFNNNPNSTEDLFSMQLSTQDGTNAMHTYWSIPDYGGRDGDVTITSDHLALYNAADERLALFYVGNGDWRSGKWQLQYKNVPLMRLAELYLTRAECNFRLSTSVGAAPVADYNRTHTRAGLPAAVSVTLSDILLERKLELAHEGHALHDLKRLRGSADGFAYNANKMVLPIPQREVDASRGVIVQNDGY